ncbi:MAG: type III-A CRISPR-associated RAMP protein Csm3 [Chloroflexi bacterium]|nr:MAG: type III-A CRISPR-associated RAMP protein Csm3 [Chloroflexota bacterium]
MKLKHYVTVSGTLKCRTGTRIGGSKEDLEIGGMDNPILRDPVDNLPYIPGSSLKGKMRSMLEYKYARVGWKYNAKNRTAYHDKNSGDPCGCQQDLNTCPVCTMFGPHRASGHRLGPSRMIVRDALLSEESKAALAKLVPQGLAYAEVKTENIINRRTNVADPRPMERVPKDTKFLLSISLRVFEGDDEALMKKYIKEALDMLQQDYLGGSGTRGYGWVEIEDLKGLDHA